MPAPRSTLVAVSMAIAGLAPSTGYAQPMSSESRPQTEEQRVLATEDEYVAAEVSRDEAALRRLIDDRFVFGTAELRFASPGQAESTSSLRYTCAYVKRQNQWRMLALQMQQRASK
jgi:hypothetical protein